MYGRRRTAGRGFFIVRIMLRIFILVGFFMSSGGSAYAEQDHHAFLWSVKGSKGTVYLLGSIHMLKAGDYPVDSGIENAYRKSRRVAFEADMEETGKESTQKALLAEGMYHDNTTLQDHISKKTYELLSRKLKQAGIPMSRFTGCKPWLCAVSLSVIELGRLGYDPKWGIDAHFYTRSKKDRKEMVFLETSGQQIDLLSRVLGNRQEDLLRQALKELDVIGGKTSEIVNAWKEGDDAKMESITGISLNEYPEIKKELFTRRNARWVPRIEALMKKEGDSLLIIGAGHLVGKDGVLALLQQKGYPLIRH